MFTKKSSKWLCALAAMTAAALLFSGFALGTFFQARAEEAVAAGDEADTLPLLQGIESPFQSVYKQVNQSVVGVNVVQRATLYGGRVYSAAQSVLAGSGVIIRVDGDTRYILTNHHVVDGASAYSITSGEDEYTAELVASDESTDIAVLKVTDAAFDLPAVPLGDSDTVEVGEWVMVIGTPLSESFANTLTVGVVSGLNREVTSRSSSGRSTTTNSMIQVDAAINSGNSGGALFNTKGELIGIPSMKMSSSGTYGVASIEGIGMAIPINTAKQVVPDLIEYQQVLRPRIGVSISDTGSDSDEPTKELLPAGVIVHEVEKGSPAEAAGIQAYDIITEADGTRVRTSDELMKIVQGHAAGETVELTIYRIPNLSILKTTDDIPEGETINVTVEVKILDAVKQ